MNTHPTKAKGARVPEGRAARPQTSSPGSGLARAAAKVDRPGALRSPTTSAQVSLGGAMAAIARTVEAAAALAGVSVEDFAKLPKHEQNDFIAAAKGAQREPELLAELNGAPGPDSGQERVVEVRLKDLVRSPFNRIIDTSTPGFAKLVDSVKKHGVLQAGIARWVNGKLEIVAGERRSLAAGAAKLTTMPFKIRKLTDEEAIELQAVENMQREDLNPIDEALKYQQLRDCYQKRGMGKTAAIEEIGEKTGASKATIYGRLTLLELPKEAKGLVLSGRLPASHAELLSRISDPAEVDEIAKEIVGTNGELMPFTAAKELVKRAETRQANLAAWQRQAAEFQAKNLRVLTPSELEHVNIRVGHNGYLHIFGRDADRWVHAKQSVQIDASYRCYEKLWKKAPPAVLARAEDMQPVVIYSAGEADAAMQQGGKLKLHSRGGTSNNEKAAAKRLKVRRGVFTRTMELLAAEASGPGMESTSFWKFIIPALIRHSWSDVQKLVAKRRGMPKGGNPADFLREVAGKLPLQEQRGLMLELILGRSWPSNWSGGWSDDFREACKIWGIDLKSLCAATGDPEIIKTAEPKEDYDDE